MALSHSQRTQLIALMYLIVGTILIIVSGLVVPLFLLGLGVYCIYEGMRRRGVSITQLFYKSMFSRRWD